MIFPTPPQGIRLIATDLDGTLLRDDKTVSPRTVEAIRRAHQAGLRVVAATGRYLTGLPTFLSEIGIDYAVTSNGAEGYRLGSNESLFEHPIETAAVAAVLEYLAERLPLTRAEVAVGGGRTHFAQPGYADLLTETERRNFPMVYAELTDLETIGRPLVKLAVRHPTLTPDELYDALLASGLSGFHPTTSGAFIVEISGAGVTKARGVAQLAELLGVEAEQVLTIGDARNDIEMLQWAGIGVAMGNAVPETIAAADHTTATNEEDGLALAIEALLTA